MYIWPLLDNLSWSEPEIVNVIRSLGIDSKESS
jgi:hypothetical protein